MVNDRTRSEEKAEARYKEEKQKLPKSVGGRL